MNKDIEQLLSYSNKIINDLYKNPQKALEKKLSILKKINVELYKKINTN